MEACHPGAMMMNNVLLYIVAFGSNNKYKSCEHDVNLSLASLEVRLTKTAADEMLIRQFSHCMQSVEQWHVGCL